MDVKIAEINLTNLAIVIFVGISGILAIHLHNENIAVACVAGLVGYLARGYTKTETTNTTNTTTEEMEEDDQ